MTLQTKYIFHKSGFIVFGAEVLSPNTQWNKGIEYLTCCSDLWDVCVLVII